MFSKEFKESLKTFGTDIFNEVEKRVSQNNEIEREIPIVNEPVQQKQETLIREATHIEADIVESIPSTATEEETSTKEDISQKAIPVNAELVSSVPLLQEENNPGTFSSQTAVTEVEICEVDPITTNISEKIAERMGSENIVNPSNNKPMQGLVFDDLVVEDPEMAAALDVKGEHTIHVEQTNPNIPLKDNAEVLAKFPNMAKIQEIIRNLGMDVEMNLLYNEFILCNVIQNGLATNKIFIVDYDGNYMNNLPKIFLMEDKFVDESVVIHMGDNLNLLNYIKGVKIKQSPEQVVTDAQRKVGRRIVNFGTHLVPDSEYPEFTELCVNKVIPFIEEIILKKFPEASFYISNYTDKSHWVLTCNPNVPFRFGELEGLTKSIIYIHASGFDNEGRLLLTPSFA